MLVFQIGMFSAYVDTCAQAYNVCNERDLVPEMVFLLGRMGNNKKALNLIIERLGDVNRVGASYAEGYFAMLTYPRPSTLRKSSMTMTSGKTCSDIRKRDHVRPRCVHTDTTYALIPSLAFIRGLLENVGAEIDPIRLIRRIKNGLEIPGLKGALIKILHDFNLQVSLLEGCQTILNGDCADLVFKLHRNQTSGFFLSGQFLPSLGQQGSRAHTLLVFSEDTLPDMQPAHISASARPRTALPLSARCARALRRPWRRTAPAARPDVGRSRHRRPARPEWQDRVVRTHVAATVCVSDGSLYHL